MVTFRFAFFNLALAVLAAASPLDVKSPLKVELSPTGDNAVLKVSVTNTGSQDLKLLSYGSFLSDLPVEKVDVFLNDKQLEFKGIYLSYRLDSVPEEAYTFIAAGQTLENTVELAGLYDFSATGKYRIVSRGAVPYMEVSEEARAAAVPGLKKALAYESNELDLDIDADLAAQVEPLVKAIEKRVVISECSGTRSTALRNGLSRTVTLAQQAANAAASGSATKFSEFFRTTAASARSQVAARFRAIASAASSTTSGSVRYYCSDVYGYCSSGVIAWTLPSANVIANCDIFYQMPAYSSRCYAQDQAGTVLHEMAHAPGIYSPFCEDYAYGYSASVRLSASQALLNADTFALYSKAIALGC